MRDDNNLGQTKFVFDFKIRKLYGKKLRKR